MIAQGTTSQAGYLESPHIASGICIILFTRVYMKFKIFVYGRYSLILIVILEVLSSDLKGFIMVQSRQNSHTFTVISAGFAPQPIWCQKP